MSPFQFTTTIPKPRVGAQGVFLPAHLETKAELFDFLFRTLPLPQYFGQNWDALEECLTDLDWLPREKVVLVHRDILLAKTPSDQKIYLQILAEAARKSSRLEILFPEKFRRPIERLLSGKD